jgi:hypothetical protein
MWKTPQFSSSAAAQCRRTKLVFKTSMFPTGEHKKPPELLIPAVL